MTRLILLTALITVVYSWEDLKATLVFTARKLKKQNYNYPADNHIDEIVGTALILATVPVNLVFLLVADGSLIPKLAVILTELLGIGLLAEITEHLAGKSKHHQAHGVWTMLSSFAIGTMAPSFRVLSQLTSQRRLFGNYLKHLTFPILFGLVLKVLTDRLGTDAVSNSTDPLIMVAVAGLLLNITIDFLESFFRANRLHLFSYFRIVLGIAIIFVLGSHIL